MTLQADTTYYWQVHSWIDGRTVGIDDYEDYRSYVFDGPVWSFTTQIAD